MKNALRAIFCDMDGTLFLNEPLHWQAWLDAFNAAQATLPSHLDATPFIGMADSDIAAYACRHFAPIHDASTLQANKDAAFVHLLQSVPPPPPPGRDTFLAALPSACITAVVTSSPHSDAERLLCGAKIAHHFDFWITREATKQHKPHAAPYVAALQRAGVRPEEALVIEDSAFGLQAALAANIPAVGIHTHADVRRNFHHIPHFDSFTELTRWLA